MFKLSAIFYDENGEVIRQDEGYWWTAGDKKLCGKLKTYDRYRPHCFIVGWDGNGHFLTNIREEQVFWFQVARPDGGSVKSKDATAEKTDADPAQFSYNLGSFVGYSEVCAQFQGNGAGNKLILALKQKFKNDPGFARGYDRFDDYTGSDTIIGLTECDRVKEALEKYYAAIS